MNTLCKIVMLAFGVLVVSVLQFVCAQTNDTPRSLAPYFTPATSSPQPPDTDGFLLRWLLLEPIKKPIRSNAVFADSWVRTNIMTEYFPDQFTVVPRDGDKVTVAGEEFAWHALDSANFNVKLFRLWPEQADVRRLVLGRDRR